MTVRRELKGTGIMRRLVETFDSVEELRSAEERDNGGASGDPLRGVREWLARARRADEARRAAGRVPIADDSEEDFARKVRHVEALLRMAIAVGDAAESARLGVALGFQVALWKMKRTWERHAIAGKRSSDGGAIGAAKRYGKNAGDLATRDRKIVVKETELVAHGMTRGEAHKEIGEHWRLAPRTVRFIVDRARRAK